MSTLTVANAWRDIAPRYGYTSVPVEVIVAQSQLETGDFTSPIFRENHNAFGMKHPQSRPTLSRGESRGHAVYDSVRDSVEDYAMRQRNFGIPDGNAFRYMSATLGSGYATDPAYARKWADLYNATGPTLAAGIGWPGIAVLGLLVMAANATR